MNRFGLEDDDSSSHQSGASLKQRRSIQLPSMYSPASNASSKNANDSTSSPVNNANAKAVVDDSQLYTSHYRGIWKSLRKKFNAWNIRGI